MGFFKNLLGGALGEAADKALSQVKEVINTAMAEQEKKAAANPKPAVDRSLYEADEEVYRTDAEWHAYFRDILQKDFAEYAVRENVPVTEIAGNVAEEAQLYSTRPRQVYRAEWGEPYTFVLYQGAAPKAVVMLGSGNSHHAKVKYLVARMYAQKTGLPYINFYTQMPNKHDYVVGRIRKFL